MTAGGDHDEAPPLHDIAGGMLIGMPVRDEAPAPLLLAEVIRRGRLDQSVGQYPLERLPRDVAGGKWALQGTCGIAADGPDPRGLECRAVERAPGARLLLARADPLLAKGLLTARKEPQIAAHAVAIMPEKPRQAAVMVTVSVAQNEPVEPFGLNAEQIEIAQQHLGGVAEVQQVLPGFTCIAGFEMQ